MNSVERTGASSGPILARVMRPFRTVRSKMVATVLFTTAIALATAGIAMLVRDLNAYRHTWEADLSTEADILALSTAPALAFDDHEVAARNLNALQARSSILTAALYSSDGKLYANFTREGETAPAGVLTGARPGFTTHGDDAVFTKPVTRNGEHLGTIYLRARYGSREQLIAYIEIFSLVTAVALGVALLLASALQRVITQPLNAMATVASEIVKRRNYELRARHVGDDELSVVVHAFNNMLDEVQARTVALEASNAALQREIDTRLTAEAALTKANARLESTMAAAEIGSWVWEPQQKNVVADRNLARLYGLSGESEIIEDISFFNQFIHPDDLPRILEMRAGFLHRTESLPVEFRVVRPDGSIRYVVARSKGYYDSDGRPTLLAGLVIDVTAQKLAEQKLREADRRKDEFLATLAHELRNPLAPILNATQILQSLWATTQQQQWAKEVIARQINHMSLLLNDLLDVSRITNGRLELKKSRCVLQDLISDALETARPLIESKHHTVRLNVPPQSIVLAVDPLRIAQSLSNVVANAAKYTDANGHITLTAELHEEGVTIDISDTGIGLSQEALNHIFEMFSQVKGAMDRAEGGLGIGLALVKGLIELHGGHITAASAGPGMGSSFKIWLPRSCVIEEETIASATPAAVTHAPSSTVLIADDNQDAAQCLGVALQLSGHDVRIAFSGRDALKIAFEHRPRALVLDIGMPDMNGYEVARQVRRQDWGKQARLIALTGWNQPQDIERARVAGFDYHLPKPVDTAELERYLDLDPALHSHISALSSASRSLSPPIESKHPPSARVALVVDDELLVAEYLGSILEDLGFQVKSAATGRDALTRARESEELSVLLVDLGLPDCSGLELLDDLRRLQPKAALIVATGFQHAVEQDLAEGGQPHHVLGKPYTADQVEALLRQLNLLHENV